MQAFDRAKASEIEAQHLGFLGWLIADQRLEIKIAFRSKASTGIYHEKIGMLHRLDSKSVAFTGSANGAYRQLVNNFESIDVYRSWTEADRVDRKSSAFEALWANDTVGLDVIDLPDVARERLIAYRPAKRPTQSTEVKTDHPG